MDEHLELLATLARGNCAHRNRVNICAGCCEELAKIVKAAYGPVNRNHVTGSTGPKEETK